MKRTALVSLSLLALLTLGGCSVAQGGSDMSEPAELAQDAGGDSSVQSDVGKTAIGDTQVVTTGVITVVAADPIAASAEAIRLVETAGGRIDSREEFAAVDTDKGSATLVLRIPAKSQTSTVDALRGLGEVQSVQITSDDVTAESADLDGRIAALQASVDRLTTLLSTASNTDSLVSIESSLSSRQAELESLQSQQRALSDQVAMSTITLRLLSEPLPPEEGEPTTFLTGLAAGWATFVGFIIGVTVVAGALLPWFVFLGIVGGIVLLIVRWRRSRRPAASAPENAATAVPDYVSAPETAAAPASPDGS